LVRVAQSIGADGCTRIERHAAELR
jgi:hypothetical protein